MPSVSKVVCWVALGALLIGCVLTATAQEGNGSQESLLKQFYRLDLDPEQAYRVSDLSLRKDNMKLNLESGVVIFLKPLDGEVTGAVFLGSGTASMKPVNQTGRYMLEKYSGSGQLSEPFNEAVMRFSDASHERFREQGSAYTLSEQELSQARKILQERNGWLDGARSFHFESAYLENRLSELSDRDFFVATFRSAEHGWLTYVHDPGETHENGLYAYGSMGTKSRAYRIPWTVWHSTRDYGPNGHYLRNPDQDGPHLMRIKHNEMEINLEDTKTVQWKTRLLIEPLEADLNVLRFDLVNNAHMASRWNETSHNPVTADSVVDVSGQPLSFSHRKDQLIVFLTRPTEKGTPITLEISGRADVIYQLTPESFGLLQSPWYPQYGYMGGRWSFDWTVRVPRPYLITGSGKVVKEFEDKKAKQNVVQLKSDSPVSFPWVIFGKFKKTETEFVSAESGRSIPVSMHSFPTMTIPIGSGVYSLNAPRKKVEQFFEEGKVAMQIYEKIYGPYPYDELHFAQMAPQLTFGQAPAGFVQLSGLFFLSQATLSEMFSQSDFVHGLLAHEIAHQWWGNQVGWASEADEWLSESFAEYASGIFVNEFQGPKRFQGTLQTWRDAALNSDRQAPLAAANTLSGPNAGDQRTDLLYNKGPYVLHMLRIQLDDEKYMGVMRSVQEKYKHSSISTEQLLMEVNRISGADYTYFFDQWFWDVGVPKFNYSWSSKKQSDGKFLITVSVTQEDKDHVKRVLMPIHIHLKNQTIPQYRPVTEAEQVIKILSPLEPKDVTLDDDRTLLAEFVKKN